MSGHECLEEFILRAIPQNLDSSLPVQILMDYAVHKTRAQLQQDTADPSSETIFIILVRHLTPHSSWVSTSCKKGKITNDLISGLNLGHTAITHRPLPKHQGQLRPWPISILTLISSALCRRDRGIFAKSMCFLTLI